MATKRILLVREGDFFVHVLQLAQLLSWHGYTVEVLNTANAEPEPLYRDLIMQARRLNITCHIVNGRAPWIGSKLLALAFRFRLLTKLAAIAPYKIRESRMRLADLKAYDLVIAIDPPSLFLACVLFAEDLGKVVEYSLEVSDESHRDFQTSRTERSFRLFERSVLPRIGALIIQDRFRAHVLLRHVPQADRVKTIYFPVAMSGSGLRKSPRPAGSRRVRVLFFGGLWSQEFLRELQVVSTRFRDDQVLVVRGGRGTVPLTPMERSRVDMSTAPIPFDEVNDEISSADIGLALYPKDEANSRCSAFASEKVARYLQCGVPFIAFRNEDYAFLQSETGCCELVADYAEVPRAVNTIMDNYNHYQRGAETAFARFYCHDKTGPELARQLGDLMSGASS